MFKQVLDDRLKDFPDVLGYFLAGVTPGGCAFLRQFGAEGYPPIFIRFYYYLELVGSYHLGTSLQKSRAYVSFRAIASWAALAPARRPKTMPEERPEPPG